MPGVPVVRLPAHPAARSTRWSGAEAGRRSLAGCSPWWVAFPPAPPRTGARPCSVLRWYYATVRPLIDVHVDVRRSAFSNRPGRPSRSGINEVSRCSRAECPYLRGVSDCAESHSRLALTPDRVWPSALLNSVSTPVSIISQLNTLPACAPVTLRWRPHGPPRMTRGQGGSLLLPCETLPILNSAPVYPGALSSLLDAVP